MAHLVEAVKKCYALGRSQGGNLSQLISITAKLQPIHKKIRASGGYAVAYTYDAGRTSLFHMHIG